MSLFNSSFEYVINKYNIHIYIFNQLLKKYQYDIRFDPFFNSIEPTLLESRPIPCVSLVKTDFSPFTLVKKSSPRMASSSSLAPLSFSLSSELLPSHKPNSLSWSSSFPQLRISASSIPCPSNLSFHKVSSLFLQLFQQF